MKNTIKVIVTAVGSFLSGKMRVLFIPAILLIICNFVDYGTGVMAAKVRDTEGINSNKGFLGIAKKVSMWLLVVVGGIVDVLLVYSSGMLGWQFNVRFMIAAFVALWLVCNELISILENIIDIGTPVPAFLMPLVKSIKKKTEDAASIEKEEK